MLKSIDPILTPDLLWLLASMGHGDDLVFVDANHPATRIAQSPTSQRLIQLPGMSRTIRLVRDRANSLALEFEWRSRTRLSIVNPCRALCVYLLLSSYRCCRLLRRLRQFKSVLSKPGMATASCRAIGSR